MILIEEFNCQLFPFDSDVVSMEIPEVFRYEINIFFLKQYDTENLNCNCNCFIVKIIV